jgi:cell division protein FtsN
MSQLTTRDYKGAGRRANPPAGLKEFLLGALAGALLAGLGTALVMHHAHRSAAQSCAPAAATSGAAAPTPSGPPARHALAQPAHSPGPAAALGRSHSKETHTGSSLQLARTGSHSGAARHAAAPAQSQYDFYQMLPNLKVTVPHPNGAGRQTAAGGRSSATAYILQVGSYRDEAQARRIVAELDSLGIIAHIDTVPDGRTTLHRVRIGPLTETAELNRIRGVLKSVRLPAIVMPAAAR